MDPFPNLRRLPRTQLGWAGPLDKAARCYLRAWALELPPEMTRIGGLNTQKIKFVEANDQFFTNGGEFCLPTERDCHLSFPC